MNEPGSSDEDKRRIMKNITDGVVEDLILDHPMTSTEKAMLESQIQFSPEPAPEGQEDVTFEEYLKASTTKKDMIPPELLPKKQ